MLTDKASPDWTDTTGNKFSYNVVPASEMPQAPYLYGKVEVKIDVPKKGEGYTEGEWHGTVVLKLNKDGTLDTSGAVLKDGDGHKAGDPVWSALGGEKPQAKNAVTAAVDRYNKFVADEAKNLKIALGDPSSPTNDAAIAAQKPPAPTAVATPNDPPDAQKGRNPEHGETDHDAGLHDQPGESAAPPPPGPSGRPRGHRTMQPGAVNPHHKHHHHHHHHKHHHHKHHPIP